MIHRRTLLQGLSAFGFVGFSALPISAAEKQELTKPSSSMDWEAQAKAALARRKAAGQTFTNQLGVFKP
jgi:hypothetical protein